MIVLAAFALGFYISIKSVQNPALLAEYDLDIKPIRATLPLSHGNDPDPICWLRENSRDKHALSEGVMPKFRNLGDTLKGRPKAALISLVRNSELDGIVKSMKQLEERWNGKYQVR